MQFQKNNKTLNLLIVSAIIITLIGFAVDLQNTFVYWGTDLRNRVVGARLIIEGIEPYFFSWHQGLSDRFLDPLDPVDSLISRVSVPPTVLALQSIIARLPYMPQKIIWLIVQWSAFLGTVFLLIKTSKSQIKTNWILVISFFLPIVFSGEFTLIQVKFI